jgi:hypothetical protein
LVGRDVAIRDLTRGIYLSQRREAHSRLAEKEGTLGKAEDFTYSQLAKYYQQELRGPNKCQQDKETQRE